MLVLHYPDDEVIMKHLFFKIIGSFFTMLILTGCQNALETDGFEMAIFTDTPGIERTSTLIYSTETIQPENTLTPELVPTASKTVSTGLNAYHMMAFMNETIPDGTSFKPGEAFLKRWTLKNNGIQSWSKGFRLVRESSIPEGEFLNSPEGIPLPQEVFPGETIQISVNLIAPQQDGQYTAYYQLQDEAGEGFPLNTVWVSIGVCDAGINCYPLSAPGSASGSGITATLSEFYYTTDTTTIIFCMNLPNRNYALDLAPVLMIDQKPAPFFEGISDYPWNCMRWVYQVGEAQIQQAEQVILEINSSVRMSPPAGDPNVACETARQGLIAQYPGLDFHCSFSMAGYYTDLKLPSGLKREDAQQIIFDAIEGAIYGPWTLILK